MLKNNITAYCIIVSILIQFTSCNQNSTTTDKAAQGASGNSRKGISEVLKPLEFRDITGKWELQYGNRYGYGFSFYRNYKAYIILYLKNSTIVFKGVYTLEDKNRIRINIFEMKNVYSLKKIKNRRDYIKTKRSYFVFIGNIKVHNKKRYLILRPQKIIIDGNNSEGYFEPVIKLKFT